MLMIVVTLIKKERQMTDEAEKESELDNVAQKEQYN